MCTFMHNKGSKMNHTISLIGIITLFLLWSAVGLSIYKSQNKEEKIGGPISIPKSIWLTYALYIYSVLPVGFLVFYFPEQPWRNLLFIIIGIFGFRFVIQYYMMYVSKNWRTKHGVAFNVSTACLLIFYLVYVSFVSDFSFGLNPKAATAWFYFVYGCIMATTLLTDSFYAVEFNKLVGERTMGDKAIWFASNEPKFDRINTITRRNNFLFILALVLISCLYISNYDQF